MMTRFPKIQGRLHGTGGFTLVEILLVMSILAVVMMAVISLYVPVQQSTVAQMRVSDVQTNLRSAVRQISLDLMNAGFLVGAEDPIFFESGTDNDPEDFTIRTRIINERYGRVANDPDLVQNEITMVSADMVANFPVGSHVRLFEPISATELSAGVVYEVVTGASATNRLKLNPGPPSTATKETVVLSVQSGSPIMQTIRYQFDGTDQVLRRVVNGDPHIVAREIDDVNFNYTYSASGKVSKIDVFLQGITEAVKEDDFSGAKTREVVTRVTLRNVF